MLLKKTFHSNPEHAENLARTAAHKRVLVCPFSPELLTNSSALLPAPSSLLYLYGKTADLPQTEEIWPLRDVETKF